VLIDGAGTTVSGAGTAGNPYRIDAAGANQDSMIVVDSPTLDLHLTGEGTTLEPLALSGDVMLSMTGLMDVDDNEVPATGEVPTWDGTKWVFSPAVTATPGAVNAGSGIGGDGSAPNPLRALVSGTWGSGSLAQLGTDSTLGYPVYLDSAGQLRTFATPVIGANQASVVESDIWTDSAGWTASGFAIRVGAVCQHKVYITRTGAPITAGSSGNITNINVATMPGSFPKPVLTTGGLSGGSAGAIAAWCIIGTEEGAGGTAGTLVLGAIPPNYVVPTGSAFTVSFMYLAKVGSL
jgi:hypothetical protein